MQRRMPGVVEIGEGSWPRDPGADVKVGDVA